MLDLLINLGLSTDNSISEYFPTVRDRQDVRVLKCNKSGVLLLSSSNHIGIDDYLGQETFQYWGAEDRKSAANSCLADSARRFESYRNVIANRKWIDIGTGAGAILDLLAPLASETAAVEPQAQARKVLTALGYKIYSEVHHVPDNDFNVATLFHVFEHLTDPIGTLRTLSNKLAVGGKLIIEVPHANDFLISFLDNEAFKAFTFWSEHLILHTRESLKRFLLAAGFQDIVITGVQRYPLANHLHWLSRGKPGGHIVWDFLRTAELDESYADMLNRIDKTDTLIATAVK